MHCVPSRCCNIAYEHSTKCNSVSLNVRVWDAASSGTKCSAIQMRPNVARRFSDFATNSRAVTSMSMLYSLSLCTRRTARWLSRCWLIELRKYVLKRRSDEKLRSASALLHGIVSRSLISCSTWSNVLRITDWADASFVAMPSTNSLAMHILKVYVDQKVEGDQYIAGPPTKSWGGLVSPGPRRCCAYGAMA